MLLRKGKIGRLLPKQRWPHEAAIPEAASEEAVIREEALNNNVADGEEAKGGLAVAIISEAVEDHLEPAMPLAIWAAVDVLEA